MKKFLFILALIFAGTANYAQTTSSLLEVVATENISYGHSAVTNFLNATAFASSNRDIVFTQQDTKLYTLRNGFKAISLKTSNPNFREVVAIHNTARNQYVYYFYNGSTTLIEGFDSGRNPMFSAVNNNGTAQITALGRSEFGKCMDAVEEDYTNDFIGWAAWNASPIHALTAATLCQGYVNGWWGAPPAYQAVLDAAK